MLSIKNREDNLNDIISNELNTKKEKKNKFAKEIICFVLATILMTTAVVFDNVTTAQGQDLSEVPHAIVAGDQELAVVASSAQAERVIDDVIAHYSGGNEVSKAYVNPVLKVEAKKIKAGEMNPLILDRNQAASLIIAENSGKNPIFTVTVNSALFRKEKIDYDVKRVKTKKLYEGKTKVQRKGQYGSKVITERGTYINGKIVNSIIYKEEVTKKPVNEIIKIGTKKRIVKGVATGEFVWPMPSSHYITSGYGHRFGPYFGNEFHMGYDIAGSYGANVVAADGGTVVKASYHPSYGNEIVIDHGNGLQTRYAHNSSLNVHVGQRVIRGETIAFCGSTGDSTGNHLHFEVLKNGSHTNPAPYL